MEEAAPEALELLLNACLLLKRVLGFFLEMISGILSWVLTILSYGRALWAWLLEALPMLYYNLCVLLQIFSNSIVRTLTLVVYLVQEGWSVAKTAVGGAGRGLVILYTFLLALLSTVWDIGLFIILTVFKLLVTFLTQVFNTVSWVFTVVLSCGRALWTWSLEALPMLYYSLCVLVQVFSDAIVSTLILVAYLVQQGWGVVKIAAGGAGSGLVILWSDLGKLCTFLLTVLSTVWDGVLFIILTVLKLLVTVLTLVFNTVCTLLELVGLPWTRMESDTMLTDRERHKRQDWPQEQWQYLPIVVVVVTAIVLFVIFRWKIVPLLVTYWRRLKRVIFRNAQPQARIPQPAQHNQPPPRFRHQQNQQQNVRQQNAQRNSPQSQPVQHHYDLRNLQGRVGALQPQPDVQLRRRVLGAEETCYVQRLQLELDQRRLCIVCQDNEREMMLKPCNHFCVCGVCVSLLRGICPICRVLIQSHERVFT